MPKYDPLQQHLKRQRLEQVVMSFRDIERVIGAMLPKSAERPQWWANERSVGSRHVHCAAWLDAGYEAFLGRGERVTFRRAPRL